MKIKYSCRHPRRFRGGFTLVELLVVMSIMVLLVALVVPRAAQIGNGLSVTSAGNMVESQLALARQTSIALNRSVEVRVYEVPDKIGPLWHFRVFQVWVYDANNQNRAALNKLQSLPQNIVFDAVPSSGGTASICSSTLLDSRDPIIYKGTEKLPSVGSGDYAYRAFRFKSGGTTELTRPGPGGSTATTTWFYTLRMVTDAPKATAPPKNYFTIQVNPYTGQTRPFRP